LQLNKKLGLGFDDWDLDYYTELFRDKLGRNPTDVECFDMGQSNSEHSRHWFFGGKMVIDGVEQADTLFKMVKDTLPKVRSADRAIAPQPLVCINSGDRQYRAALKEL
jgi:phosphoribosylformylglycinamidine synthase